MSKRAKAKEILVHYMMQLLPSPDPAEVEELVDLLVDAAVEEVVSKANSPAGLSQ